MSGLCLVLCGLWGLSLASQGSELRQRILSVRLSIRQYGYTSSLVKVEKLTFDIHIACERFSAGAVNDVDITEENFAVCICALDLVVLRLQTGFEPDKIVRVHVLCLATIIHIDLVPVNAVGHMAALIDC